MGDYKIHEIFRKTLHLKLTHGVQTRIAEATGINVKKINHIYTGFNIGTEDERRAIADFFGYEYEQFLNLGRKALGLPEVKTLAPPPGLGKYMKKALQVMEGPDGEHLKAVVEAFSERNRN
ncbi:MAG: hypothetical protein LBC90_00765 [Candidatus Adiutrix sp.]|jgi:plasmid maintenance system antidote protein VapI|nr:hypothetical protein [Candidatus Adiutrix sp.]